MYRYLFLPLMASFSHVHISLLSFFVFPFSVSVCWYVREEEKWFGRKSPPYLGYALIQLTLFQKLIYTIISVAGDISETSATISAQFVGQSQLRQYLTEVDAWWCMVCTQSWVHTATSELSWIRQSAFVVWLLSHETYQDGYILNSSIQACMFYVGSLPLKVMWQECCVFVSSCD